VTITGIYQVLQRSKANFTNRGLPSNLKLPYIYAIGINADQTQQRIYSNFTAEEEENFLAISKSGDIY